MKTISTPLPAIRDDRRIRTGASFKLLPAIKDAGRIRVGASFKRVRAA